MGTNYRNWLDDHLGLAGKLRWSWNEKSSCSLTPLHFPKESSTESWGEELKLAAQSSHSLFRTITTLVLVLVLIVVHIFPILQALIQFCLISRSHHQVSKTDIAGRGAPKIRCPVCNYNPCDPSSQEPLLSLLGWNLVDKKPQLTWTMALNKKGSETVKTCWLDINQISSVIIEEKRSFFSFCLIFSPHIFILSCTGDCRRRSPEAFGLSGHNSVLCHSGRAQSVNRSKIILQNIEFDATAWRIGRFYLECW